MSFPAIHACLVCDAVRDEMRGKMTLLGFAGVTPHTSLNVFDIRKQVSLTFVMLGGTGKGSYQIGVRLVHEASGTQMAAAPVATATLSGEDSTMIAAQLTAVY